MTRIAVIGAGTMGHGIAYVAAVSGHETVLNDTDPAALDTAGRRVRDTLDGGVKRGKLTAELAAQALGRLKLEASLERAVDGVDLAVEAIVEDLSIKQQLFRRLDSLAPPGAILATNTSSLSVSRLAEATRRPERVAGMHFFNPVHVMKLVEIVRHPGTAADVVLRLQQLALQMGKDAIVVRDSPGFASSRLGIALGLEAMRMLEEGVASAADIDKALELGYGHPMGPLKTTDLVGLDVRLAIADYLHRELAAPHFAPPGILRDKVRAGELGKKTGKGFYEWQTTPSS